MLRGLYAAASGLEVASEQQEVTAYNLAFSTMSGYRQRGVVVETFASALGQAAEKTGDIVGAKVARAFSDFRPGSIQQTGDLYNLALGEPDRFFVLNGPNGPIYTRNGAFFRAPDGGVVSQGGYPLMGEDGPITVPAEVRKFTIASDGSITTDGQPAGRLRVVRFADPSQLTAVGPTLYSAPPAAGLQVAPSQAVMQGSREGSNVEPAEAMVRMIIGSRYYDATQRALRSMSEAIQLDTRPTTA
jgi:flagellar basal-body rod protein FlgF/flagellar basal-body rod protein FlgG